MPPRPKPLQMPIHLPPDYPDELKRLTRKIITEAIKEFRVDTQITRQTQITKVCKRVVSKLTPKLCAVVGDEALSVMDNLLRYLLVANCDELERDQVRQETIESGEWTNLTEEMAGVPSAAAKDSSNIKEPLGPAPAQLSPATVANGGGMERGETTKKSIRPVQSKGGRRRVAREKSKAYHWANEVKKVLPKFREGYKLLRQFKASYPAQRAVWEREFSRREYLPLHIEALIESKTPSAAACRYVANKDGLKLSAIQNAYSRFK